MTRVLQQFKSPNDKNDNTLIIRLQNQAMKSLFPFIWGVNSFVRNWFGKDTAICGKH